ncbi:MAG: hypothetical protein ACJ74W_20205 [Pyrinomonadaceae bacterium]
MSITRRLAGRRADVCALAVIILFFAAFFGPVLWRGQFLIAGDAYYQTYPLRTVAWGMIRQGQLPLWTPFIFSGYPLLSLAQLGLGYPLTWLYLFLPGHWAEQVMVLAPFLLAPAFTYFYARELGRSPVAALLAGLVFTYGGALGGKLGGLSPMPNSLVWLPLVLLAVERARRCRFTRGLLGAACAYAMSVLAGHAQTFLLVGLLALAYAAFNTLAGPDGDVHEQAARGPRLWPRWRPLAVAVGGVLLAAGIAAFQILETMRVVRRSVRSSLSFETFNAGAFTPTEALNSFIAPLYHYIEVSTFVTPLAALLALFAVVQAIRGRCARRHIYFWLGTAVVAWVLMLGDSTPLYRLLYHLPGFNLFRYPSRHACEWSFAVSILAAYGWDALSVALTRSNSIGPARAQTRAQLIGWLLFVASALVALLWWRDTKARPRMSNFGLDSGLIPSLPEHRYLLWKMAFTVIIVLLVWRAHTLAQTRGRNVLLICAIVLACYVEPRIFCAHVWFPYAKTVERFTNVPPVERWLQQYPPAQNRIYTRVNLFVRGYWTPPPLDLPNMTAPRGLQNVAGYEQLILARYSRALGDVGPDAVNPRYGIAGAPDETLFAPGSHVLDLLNASYVVTFPHLATMPEAVPLKDGVPASLDPARWQAVYNQDGIVVWQNRRALPRAWLVAEAEAVDGEEALRRIRGEGAHTFEPRRTALVETAAAELPHLPGGELALGSAARLVQSEPNRMLIETDAPTDTVLIVSEIFYPGWVATVDERPSQIYLTDYLLRGVALPAGQHRVELRYTAPAARNGALISALSLLTLLGLALYSFRRRNSVTIGTGREEL